MRVAAPPRDPAHAGRFAKGVSGNAGGRRRGAPKPPVSAFDVIIDKTLTIGEEGHRREVTLDEALQHKLLQDAFAGDRSARRAVMKMIARREKAIAATAPPPPRPRFLMEVGDPNNANEALALLGIARATNAENVPRLKLLPWAVQAAVDRRGRPKFDSRQVALVKLRMADADQVRWPQGWDQ